MKTTTISAPFLWVALATLLGGSVGLVSCGGREEAPTTERPRAVKVLKLEDIGVAKLVELPGRIQPSKQSTKAFEVSGRIVDLPVKEGQSVTNGQALARLDPRDFRSALNSAQAQFETAELLAKRLRRLVEDGAASRQDLDLAERDLMTATAALERAQKAFDDTIMVADFDGTVAKVWVDDFANVDAKEDVMVIQDHSVLEVVIQVPESSMTIPLEGATEAERVAKVRPVVVLSEMRGREFPAVFSEAADLPDPVTRTYAVTLSFTPPEDSRIQPGMTAKVRGWIPPNPQLASGGFPVPMNAVVSDESIDAYVWKVDPEALTVSKTRVATGAVSEESVAVTGDLQPGDLIAVSGVHQLRDGQRVKVWQPD